jgi:hypothetical protein
MIPKKPALGHSASEDARERACDPSVDTGFRKRSCSKEGVRVAFRRLGPNGSHLRQTGTPPTGGTDGSIINHVGFIVQDVQDAVGKWKAAGVPVLPGNNGRLDQAWVVTPDGLRIEVLQDKTQAMPIRHEHVHFFVEQATIPEMQAWYVKHFGAKPGIRNESPVADIPGSQLRFNKVAAALPTTKGRILDHIGFDVTNLQDRMKTLAAAGVKVDRPYSANPSGDGLAFIYDPWGTYIELNERKKPL